MTVMKRSFEADMKVISIHHIAEQYLYEYYCLGPGSSEEYVIADLASDPLPGFLSKAEAEEKRGGLVGALQNYEEALDCNPASTKIRFAIIDLERKLNRLPEFYEDTKAVYPFCCTRAEIAHYYRSLGYYYLEQYQPDLAMALYRYSTLFMKSELAESEIRYLETALSKKEPPRPPEELQKVLTDAGIPVTVSNVTMALIVKAAEEAEGAGTENGWQQALDCYRMAADCTADPEILAKLRISGK